MNVGEVRVAEDTDFALLKVLLTRDEGWDCEYKSGNTTVCSRPTDPSNFRMIRLKTTFTDLSADTLYDVLHDPAYRKIWDKHMLESKDLGCLNPNNDVSYYSIKCPAPVRNRDFVLQRSWLQTPKEYYIINHSVFHKSCPRKHGFVRGTSFLTGFLISPNGKGCELGYVTHSDPGGKLPTWVSNKISSVLAPKLIKRLQKASKKYEEWKKVNNPDWKPWLYPEQMEKRVKLDDCVRNDDEGSEASTPEDESDLCMDQLNINDD